MNRKHVLTQTLALLAFVGLITPASSSAAARHTIDAEQSKLGPGIYLSNEPGAYYMGRLTRGETFDRQVSETRTNGSEYHFGYAVGEVGNCLWLGPPQSLHGWTNYLNSETYRGAVADRCSQADIDRLRNRNTFVGHANCADGAAKGPMKARLTKNASFYWNIDWELDFRGGSAGAKRGELDANSSVWYRYTTRNGYWSVVYTRKYRTWGFIPASRMRDRSGRLPRGRWGYASSNKQHACGRGPL